LELQVNLAGRRVREAVSGVRLEESSSVSEDTHAVGRQQSDSVELRCVSQ